MDYLNKALGFLREPTKSFKKEQKTKLGEALKYYLVLGIFLSVLNAIVASTVTGTPILFVITLIMTYIGLVIGAFISGIILHVFAYLFGARKGFEQTLKTVLYSSTPSLLLGWIPFVGAIFGIWNLVLQVLGLKTYHNLTTGRAILTVLVPILIGIALLIIGLLAFFTVLAASGGFPTEAMPDFSNMDFTQFNKLGY